MTTHKKLGMRAISMQSKGNLFEDTRMRDFLRLTMMQRIILRCDEKAI